MDEPRPPTRMRFGPFVLDTRRAELLRDGAVLAVRPKPFALLSALAERPNVVVSKEELMAAVWPGVVVTDDSLTQAVHDLRTVLGEEGAQFVRTVPRRGYRFDAQVVDADAVADPPEAAAMHSATPSAAALASGQPAPTPLQSRPAEHGKPAPAAAGSRSGWRIAAGALAVVGMLGAVHLGGVAADAWPVLPPTWAVKLGLPTGAAGSGAPRLSVVVLPLQAEPESEGGTAFSEPLTADLTTDLGRWSGVIVISRETAFTYRGQTVDPRQVARELNVRWVVQGSVRRRLNAVRLHLTLIDGERGRQVWAEHFELDRADLRQALERVAGTVSRELGVEVYRAEGRRVATLVPGQVEADDLAMAGWAVWFRGLTRENVLEAWRLFEAAVARDPDALRGWSGIALTSATAANLGWAADPAAARTRQAEAIRQMERLDRNDMLTQFARVGPYYRSQDFTGLLQYATALVERFPNHPSGHHQQANALMLLGRFDECLEPARKATRLGPRDTLLAHWRSVLALCHFFAGRYGKAADEARLAVQANAALPGADYILAAALQRMGQPEEARRVVQAAVARSPFNETVLRGVLLGSEPRLVEGRERLIATLKELLAR